MIHVIKEQNEAITSFRRGFFAGVSRTLSHQRRGQLVCLTNTSRHIVAKLVRMYMSEPPYLLI